MGAGDIVITSTSEFDVLNEDARGNCAIGERPALENSRIVFKGGSNNILYCEKGVKLVGSTLVFFGSNSLIYLGSGTQGVLRLKIDIYNSSVFALGNNCYTNGVLSAILSEGRHVLVGDDALLSFGIWIRTADPHLVYDVETKQRLNPSRNVFLGDHVWIGQSAMLLKGTTIGSGSIVGAASVVAGKTIPSNTSWGGNPAKQIRSGLFWDGRCVHGWGKKDTVNNELSKKEDGIFAFDPAISVKPDSIFRQFDDASTSKEKLEVVRRYFIEQRNKNRFAIPPKETSSTAPKPLSKLKKLFG